MKVLITGATGFLGEWIVKRSVEKGYEVHILARETSNLEKIKGLPITKHVGDINDIQSLDKALKGMEAVFHLAGKIAYKKSEYESMYKVNVLGTQNLINACVSANIKKMVYLSSVVAIGASFKPQVLNENSSFDIAHLKLGYFNTKHEAERLILQAFQRNILAPVILNPSTIYGAGDATKESRKIQIKVARGAFPFYTPGGVNVVHVDDVVDAFFIAFEKQIIGERIIIANENLTIKDLFYRIAAASGVEPPKLVLPSFALHTLGKFGDLMTAMGKKGPISSENAWTSTMYHWFDNSKVKQLLGIEFKSANQAITESVNWAKQHGYI